MFLDKKPLHLGINAVHMHQSKNCTVHYVWSGIKIPTIKPKEMLLCICFRSPCLCGAMPGWCWAPTTSLHTSCRACSWAPSCSISLQYLRHKVGQNTVNPSSLSIRYAHTLLTALFYKRRVKTSQ